VPCAPENFAPRLVTDASSNVGFLDAPGASPTQLVAAAVSAFERLADGAIVTVFSRSGQEATELAELCRGHAIDVIARFAHPAGGTTMTLVRR
jgi:hypothetical protein